MKTLLQYKSIMVIVGMVLAVTAIIYFIGRRSGKNAAWNPWQAPLPEDQPNGTPIDGTRVRTVADDLYAELAKWDWFPLTFIRDENVYERFNSLSDTEFVAVYNDWNIRFSAEFDGKSLLVVIKDEIAWGSAWFKSLRSTIIQRCERLKLV